MITVFPNLTTHTTYYIGYVLYHVYTHIYTVYSTKKPLSDSCWEHLVQYQIKPLSRITNGKTVISVTKYAKHSTNEGRTVLQSWRYVTRREVPGSISSGSLEIFKRPSLTVRIMHTCGPLSLRQK